MINRDSLQQLVRANLEELEQVRLEQEKQFTAWRQQYGLGTMGVALLSFLCCLLLGGENGGGFWVIAVILSIVVAIVAIVLYYKKTKPFREALKDRVKEEVYRKALAQWYPQLTYYPQQFLSEKIYKEAALFGSYDIYKGDDFFEGRLANGHKVAFSELEVQSEHRDSDNNTSVSTVFKGLLFVTELPTAWRGSIKILPDVAERGMGKLGVFFQKKLGKLGHGKSQLVYFEEYPAFEKEFVVYSSEELLARQLLSPQLVELLTTINAQAKGVAVHFSGDKLYLGAGSKREFLEVNVKQSFTAPHLLNQLFQDLTYSLELLQCLEQLSNLNLEQVRQPITPLQKKPNTPQKSSLSYKKSNSKDNPFLL